MPRLWALLPFMAVAACAHVSEREGSTIPVGAKYVALGSSFAAGAAIGPTQPDTPARCGRTTNNYASLLAGHLGLKLDDQSCGGATTAHVLNAWNELPAQLDTVDADTRLVTVTVGGNDLNYAGNLFMASCTPGDIVEVGEHEITCVAPSAPDEAAYQKLEQGLNEIARQVKARAPDARLAFVQYVSLVPDTPCKVANMDAGNAQLNRTIGSRLAEITARVAYSTGSLLLEMDKLSRHHSPCDPAPWSNGMTLPIGLSNGAPWHPNAAGHVVIARALAKSLEFGSLSLNAKILRQSIE